MNCTVCEETLPADAAYCPRCGAPRQAHPPGGERCVISLRVVKARHFGPWDWQLAADVIAPTA